MSAIIGNGTVTFGDGTVQTTKTPANVSAFTNDASYVTDAVMLPIYAQRTGTVPPYIMGNMVSGATGIAAVSSVGITWESGHGVAYLQFYNIYGNQIGTSSTNCNCNC